MATVDSPTYLSDSQDRRRQDTPDIIDVDALDASEILYVGSAQPRQRRRVSEDGRAVPVDREVIHVTDSEDENEIQFIGHNPGRLQPPPIRRDRIFSPPPPLEAGVVPPVPRIPQRFLALRPRPPSGLVIPSEDPLPFEANLLPPSTPEQPLPIAAAPSHHLPSMGFGGALLAGVRRIVGPYDTSQPSEPRNGWGISGSIFMRWDPIELVGEGDDLLDEIGFMSEDNHFGVGGVRNQIERAFKQRGREGQGEPDYRPEYTHPDQPLPGFTHDFSSSPSATDEGTLSHAASSSGTRFEVTLICAACRDPLILGASDVGIDRAKRKLWGLRCGHLLDGKCVEKLMEPTPPTSEPIEPSTWGMAESPPSSSQDTVGSDPGLMRSRLRPRRGMLGSCRSSSHSLPASTSSGRRTAPTKAQTNQRSNRKGKGKMKVPAIEAVHEWKCPVSGCGRAHFSLLVDGRWTMDEKRGPVAVFV